MLYSESSGLVTLFSIVCIIFGNVSVAEELDGLVKRIIQQQQCDELQANVQWPTLRSLDASCALPDVRV